MSSPTLQRHIAPIAGRAVTSTPAADLEFNSSAAALDAFRSERKVAAPGQLVDRKITQFANPAAAHDVAVIASASNSLYAPRGATDPTVKHQRDAGAQVAEEITRIKPDIVVVAGAHIDAPIRDAAHKSNAIVKLIPFGAK